MTATHPEFDASVSEAEIRGRSLWADALHRLRQNRAAMAGFGILVLIAILSIIGPWLSPHGYDDVYWGYILSLIHI